MSDIVSHQILTPGPLRIVYDQNWSIDDPDTRQAPRYRSANLPPFCTLLDYENTHTESSVVAIHEHGTGSSSGSQWNLFGGGSWLEDLLPLHVNECQVMLYEYALTSGYGIRAENVGIVARDLLKQLSKLPVRLTSLSVGISQYHWPDYQTVSVNEVSNNHISDRSRCLHWPRPWGHPNQEGKYLQMDLGHFK